MVIWCIKEITRYLGWADRLYIPGDQRDDFPSAGIDVEIFDSPNNDGSYTTKTQAGYIPDYDITWIEFDENSFPELGIWDCFTRAWINSSTLKALYNPATGKQLAYSGNKGGYIKKSS